MNNSNKLLSVDEVLGLTTSKPAFLQKPKTAIKFFLDQPDPSFQKPSKKLPSQAEISKPAQINKEAFDSLKEFEKSYQSYKDLNELSKIGKNIEKTEIIEKNEEKIEKNIKKPDFLEKKEEINTVRQEYKGMGFKEEEKSTTAFTKPRDFRKKKILKNGKKITIKDKEKDKRAKGQSSISSWKSEAFMHLRQQFD